MDTRRHRPLALLSFAVFAPLAVSCATQSSALPPGVETRAEDSAELVGPPQVAWADMTGPQRGRYMKEVVTPKMKALFQAYDPDQFATFGCKTCHGQDAKKVGFKMPAADLPNLPTDKDAFQKLAHEQPQMLKFMGEQVKPQLAELLGVEQFDPQNPRPNTFGCSNCHVMGNDVAAAAHDGQ